MYLFLCVSFVLSIAIGQKTPYTYIDFDTIHTTGSWTNDNTVRTQTLADGLVSVDNTYALTTAVDWNGNTVGVFECDFSGTPQGTPYTAALIQNQVPSFDAFTLEAVVKVKATANNVDSRGYIIGLEGTTDNVAGNAIAFNAITGKASAQANTFFPANYILAGWQAPTAYFTAAATENAIDYTKWYHVIVTQDAAGLVTTYVNGLQYGSSYTAAGGAKANAAVFVNINICGDDNDNVGFDGYVRAFAFYTESFTAADAQSACGAFLLCDTSNPSTSPSKSPSQNPSAAPSKIPTLNPIPACVLGAGYYVEGVPAIATGDPHFTMWNGNRHDFMGRGMANQQFYYMHPCRGKTRDEMPFSMLGRVWKVGSSSVTGLDYITLQLYDANGDEYLIWLSSVLHHWIKRTPTTKTLYDINPGAALVAGVNTDFGRRFKARYTQAGTRMDFTLTIGACTLQLYMQSQGNYVSGRNRMHYLQVMPPQCYKCFTCGLFGDFQRASTGALKEYLRTCSNGYAGYRSGWSAAITEAYDVKGWSWERSNVENNCQYWRRRRALLQGDDDDYVMEIAANFTYVDPCPEGAKKTQAATDCQAAIDGQSACCTTIGGGFCDTLQEYCNTDACLADDSDVAATELVTQPIALVCSLPDAATQLDPANLVEAPGAATWSPSKGPTVYTSSPSTPSPSVSPSVAKTEETGNSNLHSYLVSVIIGVIATIATAAH